MTHGSRPAARALVVGVDQYPRLAPGEQLRGAVADAREMAAYLCVVRGFPEAGVRLLLDGAATGEAVREGMEWLVAEARSGEPAVLYFSGHGSWHPDPPGFARRADGREKVLLLHDSPRPGGGGGDDDGGAGRGLGGSVLRPWLERLTARTANVTLVVDCCHSGAVTRSPTLRVRGIEPATAAGRRPPEASVARGSGPGGGAPAAPYVLAAACRSNQSALEDDWDGTGEPRGLFTWSLLRHLARADQLGRDPAWQDVMDAVVADAASRAPYQLPQLEGARDRRLFALGESRQRRYVRVVARDGARVVLGAGRAHRVEEGSEWDVLPGGLEAAPRVEGAASPAPGGDPVGSGSGSDSGGGRGTGAVEEDGEAVDAEAGSGEAVDGEEWILPDTPPRPLRGRIVVRGVDAATSVGVVEAEEPAGWIGAGARAVLAALPRPDLRLPVRLEAPPPETPLPRGLREEHAALAAAVARSPFLRLAAAAPGPAPDDAPDTASGHPVPGGGVSGGRRGADLRVVLLPAGERTAPDRPLPHVGPLPEPRWALADREGHLLSPLKGVGRDGRYAVVDNLEKTARHRRLLRLRNDASPLAGAVRLEVLRPDGTGGGSAAAAGAWRPAGDDEIFRPGDRFALRLCNEGGRRPLFVYVLGLGFGGSVTLLYPPAGAWEPLKPGRCVEWGAGEGDPALRLTLPPGYPYLPAERDGHGDSGARRRDDVLKVLVTTEPTDYRLFFQESRRDDALGLLARGESHGTGDLGRLLGWLVLGSDLRGDGPEPVASAEWTTLERWIHLEP